MDIRATGKTYQKLQKQYDKSTLLNKEVVSINEDSKTTVPTIMTKNSEGALVEWTRGIENVSSFIKYGYVKITKNCPYQIGKCRGEKCQLFQVRNGIGDCAHNWTAIGLWDK